MLQRVVMVAAESLKVLEPQLTDANRIQDVRVVMRPPLDAYDVLIHLSPKQVVSSRLSQDAFGDLALFFCDPPTAKIAENVFLSISMLAHRVEVSGEESHTVPNVEAILEDFRVMGQGLVKSVVARTGEWVVWTVHVRKHTHARTQKRVR
uniref:Nucleolar protein 6 n=1 Tax=Salmo trutta TaxID=8032 RepID=A0A673Z3N4_SALTR